MKLSVVLLTAAASCSQASSVKQSPSQAQQPEVSDRSALAGLDYVADSNLAILGYADVQSVPLDLLNYWEENFALPCVKEARSKTTFALAGIDHGDTFSGRLFLQGSLTLDDALGCLQQSQVRDYVSESKNGNRLTLKNPGGQTLMEIVNVTDGLLVQVPGAQRADGVVPDRLRFKELNNSKRPPLWIKVRDVKRRLLEFSVYSEKGLSIFDIEVDASSAQAAQAYRSDVLAGMASSLGAPLEQVFESIQYSEDGSSAGVKLWIDLGLFASERLSAESQTRWGNKYFLAPVSESWEKYNVRGTALLLHKMTRATVTPTCARSKTMSLQQMMTRVKAENYNFTHIGIEDIEGRPFFTAGFIAPGQSNHNEVATFDARGGQCTLVLTVVPELLPKVQADWKKLLTAINVFTE